MKKFIKCFSIVFVCAFFALLFASNKASAASSPFDTSKNNVQLNVFTEDEGNSKRLMLKITVNYTRGFDKETAKYLVCELPTGVTSINSPTECGKTDADWKQFVVSGDVNTFSTELTGTAADNNPSSKTYTVNTGVYIDSSNRENKYVIFVQSFFCSRRILDTNGHYVGGDAAGNKCQYWHNPETVDSTQFYRVDFKLNDVTDNNITDIEDEGLRTMMDKVSDIVMDIVMPIIYAALLLFLMVKGSILGIQIVKAADEPQVRQEKVGALKWLVIGVAIAYAASGLVHVVMGVLSGAFNFN